MYIKSVLWSHIILLAQSLVILLQARLQLCSSAEQPGRRSLCPTDWEPAVDACPLALWIWYSSIPYEFH